MLPSELAYNNLTTHILSDHLFKDRTESAAFLVWFLENIMRLDDVEAADAICDGPGDRGIDAIYVDEDNSEIIFFQGKIRQREIRKIGDQPLRDFAGSIAQFTTKATVQAAIETEPNSQVSMLLTRAKVAERIADGYTRKGYFVTNSLMQESSWQVAESLGITIFDRNKISEHYIEINTPDRVSGIARFDISDNGYLELVAGRAAKLYLITAKAVDLVNLQGLSDGSLFAQNVRLNLGRTKVNRDITNTITEQNKHLFFPLYHNGVTLICQSVRLQDDENLEVHDYVVVNGAQSLSVLYRERAKITDDLRCVVKIVEIMDNDDLAQDITLASNNQNAIKARDLRSTNVLQTRLQAEFEAIDFEQYRYVIKRGEEEVGKTISNEEAGRLLLAFDVREPWSCHQIYKVFDEKYTDIFGRPSVTAWRIILLTKIMERVEAALGNIESQAIQRYRLTRYFLVYAIAKIFDEDSQAKAMLMDPKSLLSSSDQVGCVLDEIEGIAKRLCVDLRFEFVEDSNAPDYKVVLKSPVQVPVMEEKFRKSFLHDVARGRERLPSTAF